VKLRRYLGTLGIMALLADPAMACSRVFPTYQVSNDFTVAVVDGNEKPLSGIQVKISHEVREPQYHFETATWSMTDEKGEISVRALPSGSYFITAVHDDVESDDAGQLEVGSKSVASRVVLQWPAHAIFSLQDIAGVIAANKEMDPVPGVVVLLIQGSSGQQIGAEVTNDKGRFQFPNSIDPGLYLLRISTQGVQDRSGMRLLQGNIFVRLDSNAKDKELPRFGLVMSSCGLSGYKDVEGKAMVIF
jgi:hypothetical protein